MAGIVGATLPSVLGLGVQKGGTTTLHHLLAHHPQLLLPEGKEIHYFSLHHARGPEWYARHYQRIEPHQQGVDITPYYLFHPEAPVRIRSLLPGARLIVLLRDPVERALSQVFHSRRLGLEPLPPAEALAAESERLEGAERALRRPGGRHRSHQEHSYLARSRYEQQLPRYERLFPAGQLLVLRSEDLFLDPQPTWSRILAFLQLDPLPLPPRAVDLRANAGAGEAAAVPASLRQGLREKLEPTYRWVEGRYGFRW